MAIDEDLDILADALNRIATLYQFRSLDTKLYGMLTDFGFDFIIRFRECIHVTSADGETRPAADWVPSNGRVRMLAGAAVTAKRATVPAVVVTKAARMKEAWCLATSNAAASSRQIIDLYSKRWSVEPSFRDTKDLRFGLGLASVRISDPQRRDRLLLLNAFAVVLLTLLGAAGESLGMISSPTLSRPAPIPCSARAACSTTSSPTCPNTGCGPSWNNTPKSCGNRVSSPKPLPSHKMRGSLRSGTWPNTVRKTIGYFPLLHR